ncbi:MAG: SDR family NAD(P)-dependent oxidoreductase [Hyphomonadaceae bacterium]|nr:SDR family NAD(P)-dependent oxidoreductase [Hyphomonadaceae bacterium]
MTLASLREGYRAAVFGGSGGLGAAFAAALAADPRCAGVYAGARRALPGGGKVTPFRFDLTDAASIAAAAAAMDGPLDLVVVATGLLHDGPLQPEKTWKALDSDALARAFAVNATGPALIARHMLGRLNPAGKAVFAALSARVGSIGDNRLGGWHAYRASKAALNMLIRTFAIELARTHTGAVCVALHPGTVDTPLSKPFQGRAGAAQLFTPADSAQRLLAVIDDLTPARSGTLVAWDGATVPF